jgi:hypothetical protein
MVERGLQVAHDALNYRQMRLPQIMHVKTNLMNCIGDVRSGEGEIPQGTHQAKILRGINDRQTICSRDLGTSIN